MNLTTSQYLILDFIKKFIAKNNYSPTVREIMTGLALKSPSTVHEHIKMLVHLGCITYSPNKSRTIELLVENEYMDNLSNTIKIKSLEENNYMEIPILLLNNHNKDDVRFIKNGKTIYIVDLQNKSSELVFKDDKNTTIGSIISKIDIY